jgi:hypothetical protein
MSGLAGDPADRNTLRLDLGEEKFSALSKAGADMSQADLVA